MARRRDKLLAAAREADKARLAEREPLLALLLEEPLALASDAGGHLRLIFVQWERATACQELRVREVATAQSGAAWPLGMPYNPKVIQGIQDTFTETQKRVVAYLTNVEKYASAIDAPEPAAGAEVAKVFKNISDEILFEKTTPEEGAKRLRKEAGTILAKGK